MQSSSRRRRRGPGLRRRRQWCRRWGVATVRRLGSRTRIWREACGRGTGVWRGRRLTTQEGCGACAEEAAAHWLGPRYSARTAYFGRWRTYLRHASRAAPQRGACQVRGMRAVGARARRARAGGRAGRTGANVPRPKRHGVPVQASDTGLRREASGRAVATAGSQAGTGREHHFFTTKRGPSLLSFSTSISSSSAMIPRCKLPRRGTPASGALRVGSGPGLSAPAPQLWARCV